MRFPKTRPSIFAGLMLLTLLGLLIVTVPSPPVQAAGGDGSFTPHATTPAFGNGFSTSVVLGDLDGDGDLDAIFAGLDGDEDPLWVNDGDGNFTAHPRPADFGGASSTEVALGDLDRDGDLDAIVANSQGQPSLTLGSATINEGVDRFAFRVLPW